MDRHIALIYICLSIALSIVGVAHRLNGHRSGMFIWGIGLGFLGYPLVLLASTW